MAGIGIKASKIISKNTIITYVLGSAYSVMVTVAPTFLIILSTLLMGWLVGYPTVGYAARELFSGTMLYCFIFSLLTASPFNAVLSRYMADAIYDERYQDILPCFYMGLLMNVGLGCLLGIPFCIWQYVVGQVDILFIFTGFCGYISLVLVFYSMLYLSVCKDYKKISLFFFLGMLFAILLSLILVYLLSWEITYSMLFSLVTGFLLTAALEIGAIKGYFKYNSNRYKPLFLHFKKYWMLIFSNLLYTLGLYIHNFVFWNTNLQIRVANSFIYAPPYDLATFLAMFTNISCSVIFISRVEMHFHGRYKSYSEAVIGGKGGDIESAKGRMFAQLSSELLNLVRIQFIISAMLFLVFIVTLPRFGFAGLAMRIYPSLAAGYFIVFIMYSALIFLYYFNDLIGALMTAFTFAVVTCGVSLYVKDLSAIWYGVGVVAGAFAGWSVAYARLRWVEKNIDFHIFCRGQLIKKGKGKKPPQKVYDGTARGEV